jgi:hypothetical protein
MDLFSFCNHFIAQSQHGYREERSTIALFLRSLREAANRKFISAHWLIFLEERVGHPDSFRV